MTTNMTRVALVTGGSTGLGRALANALVAAGWDVLTDGRSETKFKEADLPDGVTVVVGDLTDADHRDRLVAEVRARGRLDLLVHNASTLGPLPMRPLAEVEIADLQQVWRTNIGGPLVLTSALLPWLREAGGVLLSISSDAAVQHYETWGLYGASKAALDHVTLTYAAEAGLTGYAVDPGDMRTAMHQDAFPGEDISDRPLPESVVPRLLTLVQGPAEDRPASGRYRAEDLG
ncbi:short-chain dehydrogenase [Nocardioides sp. Root122]|uniref:SDR family oxidoreductase n=1 Tax=Nocardioides TaxID=1839 RepID=UPI000702F78A|nr:MULTISPECIES: SDR family oxidoreductase [Nocardioides]KQV63371.1 short-chain dehydrogenase [Nocardioides sp. Root122]MCK9825527.1 SDR family oxidoreductase [Nocardioides cavernae]